MAVTALMYVSILQPVEEAFSYGLTLAGWLRGILSAKLSVAWYLEALVLWRLLAYSSHAIAERTATPMWPWLVGASAVCHNINPFIALEVWSFNFAAVFLPAFVLGVLFPVEDLMKRVPHTWTVWATGALVCGSFVLLTDYAFPWGPGLFHSFWKLPTKEAREQYAADPCASEAHISLFWAQGLFSMLVQTAFAIVFLVTLCPRASHWFTFAGGEGCLYAYLLHPVFLCGMYGPFVRWLPLPILAVHASQCALQLLQLLMAICLVLSLASRPCIRVWSWLFKPTWFVDSLFPESPRPSEASGASNENQAK
jgi:hypothetical protein